MENAQSWRAEFSILPEPMRVALRILLEAEELRPPKEPCRRQFALEIGRLHAMGLSNTQLRWLIQEGLVEHLKEVTCPKDRGRRFRTLRSLMLPRATCCLLTASGVDLARQLAAIQFQAGPVPEVVPPTAQEPSGLTLVPRWDRDERVLWWGLQLLLEFRRKSAPVLGALLDAFQQQHWRARILNPFGEDHGSDPDESLHNAINNLNRRLKLLGGDKVIHFCGSGVSCKVYWKKVHPSAD